MTGGGTPSTKISNFWQGDIPWISSSDLFENDIYRIRINHHISEDAVKYSSAKLIQPKSILVVTRVGLGKVAVNEQTLCTSQDFTSLFSKNMNPYYFAYLIQKTINKEKSQGSTIKGISSRELAKQNISYPSIDEQNKISALINEIDKKTYLVSNKITILKKYKIGLVNNWFNNDKNHVKLASLVHNKASQLLTSHISNNKGIYAVYDASGTPYKSIDFYNTEADSISIIKYGSGCGRTFIAKGKHSVLGTMVELIPNNEKNLMYLYAYTLSNSFKKICKKYIEIGTTPNLYYSDFSKADVYYPNNRDLFIIVFETLMKIEDNLYLSLNNIKLLKKYLLNTLFI